MKFSDITGQDAIKDRLRRSVRENRVSHAQLFFGPEGAGKLAMALAYAQYINCTKRTDSDSCGECSSCIKYEKIIHPDLHFIYPIAKTKEVPDKPQSKLFINQQFGDLFRVFHGVCRLANVAGYQANAAS